jgi:hypothetical protein
MRSGPELLYWNIPMYGDRMKVGALSAMVNEMQLTVNRLDFPFYVYTKICSWIYVDTLRVNSYIDMFVDSAMFHGRPTGLGI